MHKNRIQRVSNLTVALTVAVVSLSLTGCLSDSGGSSDSSNSPGTTSNLPGGKTLFAGNTSIEGYWSLVSFLESDEDCNAAGVSPRFAPRDSLAAVVNKDYSTYHYLALESCADRDACTDILSGALVSWEWGANFTYGSDATGYNTVTVMAGTHMMDDNCAGYIKNQTLVVGADGNLTYQQLTSDTVYFSKDAEGICWTDSTERLADGTTCSNKQVVILAPLP